MAHAVVKMTEEERAAVPEVVRRYLAGEPIPAIAAEKRVDRRKLYDWMFTELGEEAYRELVTRCLVARVADSDSDLEEANDQVTIAKRREQARFARMDLERRRPALYGVKQEVKHSGAVPSFTVVLLDRPSGVGEVKAIEAKGEGDGEVR